MTRNLFQGCYIKNLMFTNYQRQGHMQIHVHSQLFAFIRKYIWNRTECSHKQEVLHKIVLPA